MKIIGIKVKKYINGIISKKFQSNYEGILKKIKDSSERIISFDVFDTLIKRNIDNPDQIFELLEILYNKEFGCDKEIKKLRKKAELVAREDKHKEEISIHDIYSAIEGFTDVEKQWLEKKEIEIELDFCTRNKSMARIYDWCIQNKKIVIIVSDMYLPESVIKDMLLKCGYIGWYKLYVSSEYKKLKSTGSLFKFIMKENKYFHLDILHIGDSLKGDFLMPRKLGIKAILIPTVVNNTRLIKNVKGKCLSDTILFNYINNNISLNIGWYEEIGYCILGPLLFGYTKWLIQKLKKNKIQKVFFLTREGTLLKKAFDLFDVEKELNKKILSVSRKAVTVPLLTDINSIDELRNYIYISREKYTLKQLFYACGLKEDTVKLLADEKQLDLNNLIFDNINKDKIFNEIRSEIINNSLTQKEYILKYLKEFEFNGKVAVADVGWHGTIQKALQELVPEADIYGFYCGCLEKDNKKDHFNGCYFNEGDSPTRQEVMFTASLFEMMFLSTDGSCIGYKENQTGQICADCAMPEQCDSNIKIIKKMQNMALLFVRDFNTSKVAAYMEDNNESYYFPYHEMICDPNRKFISKLKQFSFLNGETEHLVPTKSTLYYLVHLDKLKTEFLNSSCKLLYLRSILKIPLPYIKILSIMQKYEKRK